MRVVIIGLGDVGQKIARTLSAERHEVTIVDRDVARAESMQGELDAFVVSGNGASPKVLRELGVGDADLLCAVTQSDEVNVITALAARQMGAKRTVARVRDDDYFDAGQSLSRDVLGIDLVIHPERATADDLAEAILLPGAVHVEHFAEGRVSVAETILTARSPLLGRGLGERRMVRPHSVVGIIRDGRTLAAEPGHRPKAGDHLVVCAAHEDIRAVVSYTAGQAAKVNDVVIFGGGRVGLPLALRLERASNLRVVVMERDAERARYVAERVSGATVLHEEGLAKEALHAHGVDRAGAFVACAGDDRANLLAALHAKQIGAELCLAVVSREEFVPLVDALHIDASVSPRLVTAEAILSSVRGEHVQAMHLMSGGAEVLEVSVESGCRGEELLIDKAEGMSRSQIGAIVRNGHVVIPEADERLRGGDRVVVFSPRTGLADVRRTFQSQ